jgi:4-hydroxy-4-methyl-2-oxoglutarate aldolase
VAAVHEALGRVGVAVVPRADVPRAITSAQARVEKERASRAAFAQGELGLDRYGLRGQLATFGIRYVSFDEYQQETG